MAIYINNSIILSSRKHITCYRIDHIIRVQLRSELLQRVCCVLFLDILLFSSDVYLRLRSSTLLGEAVAHPIACQVKFGAALFTPTHRT